MQTIEVTSCAISSDRLRLRRDGRLLLANASGVLGLRECLGGKARIRAALQDSDAVGVIVDLRSAVLTMTMSEYARYVQAALLRPVRLPVAFVVCDAMMQLGHAHELLFKRRGLERRFFVSALKARRWASRPRPCRPAPDLLS